MIAELTGSKFEYTPMISAVTDAVGRYELHGQPRGVWVGLDVNAPEAAELLGRLVQRPTSPAQSTVEINVEGSSRSSYSLIRQDIGLWERKTITNRLLDPFSLWPRERRRACVGAGACQSRELVLSRWPMVC